MFNIILACDLKMGIAKDGSMPWKLPSDLKYFKNMTNSENFESVIIMGYSTYKSIGRVLPGRLNIVITKNHFEDFDIRVDKDDVIGSFHFDQSKPICFNDFDYAIELLDNKDIWVIGGSQIYNIALNHPKLDKLYVTYIMKDFECDTNIVLPNCNTIKSSKQKTENGVLYQHVILEPTFNVDKQYLRLCKDIMLHGQEKETRNGVTKSLFSKSLKFNLDEGFPILTTKKVFWRGIVEELLFFIRGDTNSKLLEDKNIKIWSGNTTKEFINSRGLNYDEGMMGPMYGYQWRSFNGDYPNKNGIDQLENVINEIKTTPNSRRIIMTDYNPQQVNSAVLPPCHSLIMQFSCEDEYLDCIMFQRSADTFLGLPFNISSSSLLLSLIAKVCNMKPRYLTINLGDVHIYEEHYDQINKQMIREPKKLPILNITKDIKSIQDIEKLCFEDIKLDNYDCHSPIKAEMKV
jgi:dihydrofolate reductase/thymidylate synthase